MAGLLKNINMSASSLILGLLSLVIIRYICRPSGRVRDIPTIPFHVSVYDMCLGIGKTTFYENRLRQPLEKHGAVNIWNAGRWTVLVTKPEYLTQIFRSEHIFAKGGFYKKVPWGVFARLFGENVIDSHGELWKQFSAIVKPGIQRSYNINSMRRISSKLASLLLVEQSSAPITEGILVDSFVQRWAVSIYGDYFLDSEFECLSNPNTRLQRILTQFKKGVNRPIISGFPFLERLNWLIPSCRRAFELINEMERELLTITDSQAFIEAEDSNTKLIHHLRRARSEGKLSEFHYRSHLKVLFVAGHENVHLLLVSLLWELADKLEIQQQLRDEVITGIPFAYTVEDLNSLPLLAAVIYEALRLYPPLSQLTNRVTLGPVCLGEDIMIPEGTWVGWSAYGVHTDANVWGPSAQEFKPGRWGQNVDAINNKFRLEQAKGNYIPFNAHSRRCLGSGFALVEIKVALCELLRKLEWRRDPHYKFAVTQGVTLWPKDARFVFKRRD